MSAATTPRGILLKLRCLEYPNADSFDENDELQFRQLVFYLEDQIIRKYKVDERGLLRNVKNQQWPTVYKKYLTDLGCPPAAIQSHTSQLEWLLAKSVSISYSEAKSDYNISAESYLTETTKAAADGEDLHLDPLENINYDSDGMKNAIKRLATLLDIPNHPDHKQMFQAACIVIQDKLNSQAIEQGKKEASTQRVFMKMEEVPLGFQTNDLASRDIAVILRLLHLKDLRDLQNIINATLVQVQALTADPKTDERLGKVGF